MKAGDLVKVIGNSEGNPSGKHYTAIGSQVKIIALKGKKLAEIWDGQEILLSDLELVNYVKSESKGGSKHDAGKNRLELIPVEAIEQIGLAYTFGASKYDDNNWRQGFKYTRLVAALLRHTYAWLAGQDNDPESGLSHLAHAGACLTMLIAHQQVGYGEDDRVKTKTNV